MPVLAAPIALAALVLLAGLAASPALALPRYSAQYGQRCALCHVEPTGGGLRTTYASMALVPEELSFLRPGPEAMAAIRPNLTDALTVGLDLRSLVHQAEGGVGGQLDMQGDVHVGVQMDPRFAAYVTTGKGGTREYAGLAYVLPAGGYLKAGRFTPDYGWRWADHTVASRQYLLDEGGSPSPASLTDAGLEVGLHGQVWEATGSLLEGGAGNGESYAARLALRRSLGAVNLAVGASLLRRELPAGHVRTWGGFGYAAVGRLSWVFEVDETGNGRREGVLVTQELGCRLTRGITALGTFSYRDPDRHQRTGAETRWGAGVDALISPFFGAQLLARRTDARPGELVAGPDTWQGELVLHFLY